MEQLTLDKTEEMKCDNCGHQIFMQAFLLRKASKFITGTGRDQMVHVSVMMCASCQHVNKEFIPLEIINEYTEYEDVTEIEEGPLPSNVREMDTNGKLITN